MKESERAESAGGHFERWRRALVQAAAAPGCGASDQVPI